MGLFKYRNTEGLAPLMDRVSRRAKSRGVDEYVKDKPLPPQFKDEEEWKRNLKDQNPSVPVKDNSTTYASEFWQAPKKEDYQRPLFKKFLNGSDGTANGIDEFEKKFVNRPKPGKFDKLFYNSHDDRYGGSDFKGLEEKINNRPKLLDIEPQEHIPKEVPKLEEDLLTRDMPYRNWRLHGTTPELQEDLEEKRRQFYGYDERVNSPNYKPMQHGFKGHYQETTPKQMERNLNYFWGGNNATEESQYIYPGNREPYDRNKSPQLNTEFLNVPLETRHAAERKYHERRQMFDPDNNPALGRNYGKEREGKYFTTHNMALHDTEGFSTGNDATNPFTLDRHGVRKKEPDWNSGKTFNHDTGKIEYTPKLIRRRGRMLEAPSPQYDKNGKAIKDKYDYNPNQFILNYDAPMENLKRGVKNFFGLGGENSMKRKAQQARELLARESQRKLDNISRDEYAQRFGNVTSDKNNVARYKATGNSRTEIPTTYKEGTRPGLFNKMAAGARKFGDTLRRGQDAIRRRIHSGRTQRAERWFNEDPVLYD
jgi:hypothetical protein